jgi:4-hydroxy-2-oxoglutarate aldolase
MQTNWVPIKGVIPPMITPFDAQGEIDHSAFIHNIEKWNTDQLAGYLVIGSNSETAFLSADEKLVLVKLAVRHRTPGRHLMAGTGCESLRETIAFTQACADLGVESALVLTPHYYDGVMDSDHLTRFFTALADQSPIPILIYNVPQFTHVNIKADAIKVLSQHPNIVGMKDSNGDVPQMANFLRVADAKFQIFVGTASAWYPALCMGVVGGILALANCSPNECASVQEAYDQGRLEQAFRLYQALLPVNSAVTALYGIPGLKYACDLNGYLGGQVRSPLMACPEDGRVHIEKIFTDLKNQIQTII